MLAFALLLGSFAKAQAEIIIEVDSRTQVPLNRDVYGFNTNLAPGHFGFLDDEFIRHIGPLQPVMLRFPGGTVANFYHWAEEGFRLEEMDITRAASLNRENLDRYQSLQSLRKGRFSFDDFMVLCKRFGIEPLVVVNLSTGTPEESAAWVRYAKQKGYKIKRWELGNEFYIRIYRDLIGGPGKYLQIARRHADAMRREDPEIQLAVPASGTGFFADSGSKGDYRQRWDQAMTQADFADAIAVHAYWRMPDTDNLDILYRDIFSRLEQQWDPAMKYYRDLYGDMPLWLTEWNIRGFGNRTMNNTQLHAMFIGDHFIRILNSDTITLADYHQIAARGKWPSLFSKAKKKDMAPKGATVKRAAYFPFQLIGEVLAKAESRYDFTIGNNPEIKGSQAFPAGFPAVNTSVLGGAGSRWYFLLLNRSRAGQVLKVQINGSRLAGRWQLDCVANRDLAATNGGSKTAPSTAPPEVAISRQTGSWDRLQLPGNSFCSAIFDDALTN
ncbi:hypothetical protein [endosymbiont of Lamellibrachia barhami]|uniref:hypothetical protein n=1 Tax=endosymbiont of Lamellibrachia barhami TaxID=205975 RepID=UPI0015AF1C67|nr:hypothetical protein [endosymbiont of Lamellibrachia barhami]